MQQDPVSQNQRERDRETEKQDGRLERGGRDFGTWYKKCSHTPQAVAV